MGKKLPTSYKTILFNIVASNEYDKFRQEMNNPKFFEVRITDVRNKEIFF